MRRVNLSRGKRKGAEHRRTASLGASAIGTLITVGVLTLFAFSSSLAGFLPKSTWFVVLFVALAVALAFFLQWIARRSHL